MSRDQAKPSDWFLDSPAFSILGKQRRSKGNKTYRFTGQLLKGALIGLIGLIARLVIQDVTLTELQTAL